jgi:hypothetical protein
MQNIARSGSCVCTCHVLSRISLHLKDLRSLIAFPELPSTEKLRVDGREVGRLVIAVLVEGTLYNGLSVQLFGRMMRGSLPDLVMVDAIRRIRGTV